MLYRFSLIPLNTQVMCSNYASIRPSPTVEGFASREIESR